MENRVNIYALDSKGRGIGRIDGKIVFVKNALVDEKVILKITKENKNYSLGEVESYICKSNKRIHPKCPLFGKCGGCDIMHMSYTEQLKFKEEKVRNTLASVISSSDIQPIIPTTPFAYRNKVTLQVDKQIGFYEKETHQLVEVETCFLLSDTMNFILKKIKESIPLSILESVMIREGKDTKETLLYLKVWDSSFDFMCLKDIVTTLVVDDGQRHVVFGPGFIHEKLENFVYKISPTSFFQVNTEGAMKLYQVVKNNIPKNASILDLYCGTGSIGIFASSRAKSIYGVEMSACAIEDALQNKEINHIKNASFECTDTSLLTKSLKDIDVVIVDPPRSGLHQHTREYLIREKVPKIIYVSCDLMTLKRDLEEFMEEYTVLSVTPVDLFPNTYHVENVCVLKQKDFYKKNLKNCK